MASGQSKRVYFVKRTDASYSLAHKLAGHAKPGAIILLTDAEMEALRDMIVVDIAEPVAVRPVVWAYER